MVIPADGILIEGSDIVVNEFNQTGEKELVRKECLEECEDQRDLKLETTTLEQLNYLDVPSPVVLSGSILKQGTGQFVVIAVGANTYLE